MQYLVHKNYVDSWLKMGSLMARPKSRGELTSGPALSTGPVGDDSRLPVLPMLSSELDDVGEVEGGGKATASSDPTSDVGQNFSAASSLSMPPCCCCLTEEEVALLTWRLALKVLTLLRWFWERLTAVEKRRAAMSITLL